MISHSGSIREAVEDYKKGKLKSATRTSVHDHYGMVGRTLTSRRRHNESTDD